MEFYFENVVLTEKEFWKIKKIYALKIQKIYKKLIALLLSLLCGWLSAIIADVPIIFYLFLAFIAFYILFYFIKVYLISYIKFKKAISKNVNQTMIFNKEGVKFEINGSKSELMGVDVEIEKLDVRLKWDDIKRIYKSDDFYFFIYSKKLQWPLPIRLFESSEQEIQFERFVDNNCRIYIQRV